MMAASVDGKTACAIASGADGGGMMKCTGVGCIGHICIGTTCVGPPSGCMHGNMPPHPYWPVQAQTAAC